MDRMRQVRIGLLVRIKRTIPETLILVSAATTCDYNGQGDFTFPEVITHRLADYGCRATIIKGVIDQLECNAEMSAELEGVLLEMWSTAVQCGSLTTEILY